MMPTRTGFKVLSAASQPLLRAIGRVVGSDVLADTVAFFQAFAGMESGFRDRAAAVTALLHDPSTRFVLVTAPQHDMVAEAAWFAGQLREQQFDVAATIVNRIHPRFGDGTAADAQAKADASPDGSDAAALWRNLADLRTVAAAERAALEPLIGEVGAERTIEVPLLATDVHDLDALTHLARHLFP